jgi:hypothetical protein
MSKFSDHLEEKLLNHIFRGVDYVKPGAIYIGLFTEIPADALGTPTGEVLSTSQWSNYGRVDAANGNGTTGAATVTGWEVPNATQGSTSNAKVITFAANNGAASVTIKGIGIFDGNSTSANLLFHSLLATEKTLLTGDVLSFGENSITVTLA